MRDEGGYRHKNIVPLKDVFRWRRLGFYGYELPIYRIQILSPLAEAGTIAKMSAVKLKSLSSLIQDLSPRFSQ
jgi:hypothetical protein